MSCRSVIVDKMSVAFQPFFQYVHISCMYVLVTKGLTLTLISYSYIFRTTNSIVLIAHCMLYIQSTLYSFCINFVLIAHCMLYIQSTLYSFCINKHFGYDIILSTSSSYQLAMSPQPWICPPTSVQLGIWRTFLNVA